MFGHDYLDKNRCSFKVNVYEARKTPHKIWLSRQDKTRQDIYYHNIVYNFLSRSKPKTLVVACQITVKVGQAYPLRFY